MDEKRTALAVLLSIVVILVYQRLTFDQRRYEMAKYRAEHPQATLPPGTTAVPQLPASPLATAQPGAAINTGVPGGAARPHPTAAELRAAPTIVVDNGRLVVTINTLGGRFEHVTLRDYKLHLGAPEPYDMVSTVNGGVLPLAVYSGGVSDDHTLYTLESSSLPVTNGAVTVQPGSDLSLRLSGTLPSGNRITKTFHFLADSHLFHLTVELGAPPADGSSLWLEWSSVVSQKELAETYNLRQLTTLGTDNKVVHTPLTEVAAGIVEHGSNQWISYGDTYFMTTLIPETKSINTRIGKEGDTYFTRVGGEAQKGTFSIYSGPKLHSELKQIGFQLERNVDLGWFAFLAHPLLWCLKSLYQLLGNWGLAIIVLTLCIKTLFLPLTQASFKSMKAMQDLQPEIKALRERIKDPTQLNQETLALYKKRGVNPAGGCFPMLIQIPVFLGLYNALLHAIELRHAPFALWINDLSSPERLEVFGIGIPVMILIMGATMMIQQWTTPTAADPAQKKAMMMMPFVFTIMFIIFPFPAGLVLYWLVNNLISIIQQVYMRRETRASPFHATVVGSVMIFTFGYLLTLI